VQCRTSNNRSHSAEEEARQANESTAVAQHGTKKKMRKMKAKNNKKEGKISFKFSDEHNSKSKYQTGDTIAPLA
jgi:hypothetical protein